MLFTPIATSEELEDKTSWVNNSFEYPIESYNSFFKSYGEAIAAWAKVESSLFTIYAISIKSAEYRSMASGFYSLSGFRAKLDLTNSCVRNVEKLSPDITVWKELYKQCSKKSQKRNFLAHGATYYDHVNPKDHRKFFMAQGHGIESRMYETDISAIRDLFLELGEQLTKFCFSLKN